MILKDMERRVELAEDILASMINLGEPPHKIERWRDKLDKYRSDLSVFLSKNNSKVYSEEGVKAIIDKVTSAVEGGRGIKEGGISNHELIYLRGHLYLAFGLVSIS